MERTKRQMTTEIPFFSYDAVLGMNASYRIREAFPAIEELLGGRLILAATLNHRFFKLHEKNFIKGTIETHALDHIHFSMRPSSQRLVADSGLNVERFKDSAQVVFVLQIMARYGIKRGIVEGGYLEHGDRPTVPAAELKSQIEGFLEEVTAALSPRVNVKKQFPWLFSLESLWPKLTESSITFLWSFPREVATSHEYDDNQITPLEKDLFWVGFDPSYKAPPIDKPSPSTKWTRLAAESPYGKGLFEPNIRYCTRCCLPETMEGISFDEVGICGPCRSSEQKMHINWEKRQAALGQIIDKHRSDSYYDLMLPMSGGKDSTYQAHILRNIYNVTPLAVTSGQNWYSLAGRYNLENCLQQFDLDHIIFLMNRRVVNKMARKSLAAIGDACWHCHIGAGAFPIQVAVAWKVGLMIWGESIAEADGRGSYYEQGEASPYYNLEVSARVRAEDMADEATPKNLLSAWFYPSESEVKASALRYLHLGNYFFWDEERQVEFIKRNYEWMESPVENTFKGFKSVECVMSGVHDYSNFLKRGIGRATIHAATDVKRGLLTREEGFQLAKEYDTQRPHALDYYLGLTGFSEEEFEQIVIEARVKSEYAMKMSGE